MVNSPDANWRAAEPQIHGAAYGYLLHRDQMSRFPAAEPTELERNNKPRNASNQFVRAFPNSGPIGRWHRAHRATSQPGREDRRDEPKTTPHFRDIDRLMKQKNPRSRYLLPHGPH